MGFGFSPPQGFTATAVVDQGSVISGATANGILFANSSSQVDSDAGALYTGAAPTVASAVSAVLNNISFPARTVTVSGATNITTATGFNLFEIGIQDTSTTVTITNAATLAIRGAPTVSGGGAITNKLALWVLGGNVQFGPTVGSGFSYNPTTDVLTVGAVTLNKAFTDTSGTLTPLSQTHSLSDGGTNSTTIANLHNISPTINYTGATRTGRVGLIYLNPTNTSLPTGNNGAIVLSSTAVTLGGIRMYSTSDEATNYSGLQIYNDGSFWLLSTFKGGTGTHGLTRIGGGTVYANGNLNSDGSSAFIVQNNGSSIFTFGAASLMLADAVNLAFNATTGTKIGTATTQKLSFWNAAPVVQPAHIADPAGGGVVDAEARTAINAILAQLATTGMQAAS